MSLDAGSNPTGVNPFNGMSDSAKAETHFDNLWSAGAFNPDGKPDPAQGQTATVPEPAQTPSETRVAAQTAPDPAPIAAEPEVAAEADEGPEYVNLEDYLQKANVAADSFYELPVTVKVDGKTSQVKLSDVLRAYQTDAHVTKKSQALADQQRAFETAAAQKQQALESQLGQAKALGDLAHQQLLAEFQGVDWNKLRTEDPARWAVANQDFQNRANSIQNHLAQVQAQQQQLATEAQKQLPQKLAAERDKMLDAVPEWRDNTKFQAARSELSSYARNRGFTDAEISNIFDHRMMLVLRDASQFAQLQAKGSEAAKRVRAAPQMANPGARISRDPAAAARAQLKSRFTKNPRDQDAAAGYFGTLA